MKLTIKPGHFLRWKYRRNYCAIDAYYYAYYSLQSPMDVYILNELHNFPCHFSWNYGFPSNGKILQGVLT